MASSNVELARNALTALNETYASGDLEPWRRHVQATFAPEIVLEGGSGAFTEGDWRGHEGMVEFVANQMEVLEGMWVRERELIDIDDERLIVGITFGGRARHTGLEVELSPFHVFHLRDGSAVRWQVFTDRDEALAAAGNPTGG